MMELINQQTTHFKKLSCCICGTDSFKIAYKRVNRYATVRCKNCGLVYLDQPGLKDDFIVSSKRDEKKTDKQKIEYWSFPHLYQKYQNIFDDFFQERLERICHYHSNLHSIFDVGCGYGFFMNFCSKRGFEVEGTDPSREAVDYARNQLHLKVSQSSLEDFTFTRKYDAMILCDVLEHIKDPGIQLKKLHENMTSHSLLFIQVPNVIGFKLPLDHGYGLPFHLWQFNLKTLTLLLQNSGFRTLNHWTGIQGVIGSYEREGPSLKERCLWYIARRLKIGNRLIVVAQPC